MAKTSQDPGVAMSYSLGYFYKPKANIGGMPEKPVFAIWKRGCEEPSGKDDDFGYGPAFSAKECLEIISILASQELIPIQIVEENNGNGALIRPDGTLDTAKLEAREKRGKK
jgi:hypothetical protein